MKSEIKNITKYGINGHISCKRSGRVQVLKLELKCRLDRNKKHSYNLTGHYHVKQLYEKIIMLLKNNSLSVKSLKNVSNSYVHMHCLNCKLFQNCHDVIITSDFNPKKFKCKWWIKNEK